MNFQRFIHNYIHINKLQYFSTPKHVKKYVTIRAFEDRLFDFRDGLFEWFKFCRLGIAWKAILLVPPYIRVKRGCAGITPGYFYCLEGSTSRKVIHGSQLCTAFQAGKDSEIRLSEGILSFVEYASRLLIVLPSRQAWTIGTWTKRSSTIIRG